MSDFDLKSHLLETYFEKSGEELVVGGIPVSKLAEEHGTPLYVYDAAILRRNLDELRGALPKCIEIYFSVKANPNPAVIRHFVQAGTGLEIASAAEFLRAHAGGGDAERILFAGPGKGEAELDLVVRAGIGEIHIESDEEIERLEAIAKDAGKKVHAAVRVNPSAAGTGGAMRMGGQAAAFGIDEERLEEVVRRLVASEHLEFSGVHMFAGTQILDAAVLCDQWSHALEVAKRAAGFAGAPVVTVDLGGGLGVPYFAHEKPLDLAAVREGATALFAAAEAEPLLAGTRFILEPGRYLAGPAGLYLARVLSVKESRGKRFVILDGGMHHHLAASGNLGQVIKRDYPIVNASRLTEDSAGPAVTVGPLCTPLDTIGRQAELPETKPGDLVAVLQSGAYGLTASPVGFLSHPMPAEVLIDNGAATTIRPRGTFEQPIVPLP